MDESPLKKKRKTKKDVAEKPTKCLIHADPSADDSTLSTFTQQSWKVGTAFCFFLHTSCIQRSLHQFLRVVLCKRCIFVLYFSYVADFFLYNDLPSVLPLKPLTDNNVVCFCLKGCFTYL